MDATDAERVALPDPERVGAALGSVLRSRRSRRDLADGPISREAVATLCFAAQGVTDEETGFRTAPSAGATFPLAVALAVGADAVPDLSAGVYRYRPDEHALRRVAAGDPRARLYAASHRQSWVRDAPVSLVLLARPGRTTGEYGDRGRERYVPIEVGHAGQNVYLAVEALDLATVGVGAFDDEAVAAAVHASEGDDGGDDAVVPMMLYPVGRRDGGSS